jgi:glycosyl-4,4'-diaponeurosporenoate acyltransferase
VHTGAVLLDIHWTLAVALDVVVWPLWSLAVGLRQARRPWQQLHATPPAPGERRLLERRLRITRWKDRLPEAGSWFGGLSKRRLPAAVDGGLDRFVAECVRAERTHAWILAATPLFAVWNPLGMWLANGAVAVAANAPCLLVARYNRARVEAVRVARSRRR